MVPPCTQPIDSGLEPSEPTVFTIFTSSQNMLSIWAQCRSSTTIGDAIKRSSHIFSAVKMFRTKYAFVSLLFLTCLLAACGTVRSQPKVTQMTTTTAGATTSVYAGPPVTILGTHGVCGIYFVQAFNGTAGQVLTGSVNASSAVNVYVMTSTVYQSWEHQVVAGGDCVPSSAVSSQESIKSYSLSATIPASGTYDLIINNLSKNTVTVQLTAALTTPVPEFEFQTLEVIIAVAACLIILKALAYPDSHFESSATTFSRHQL